MSERRRRRRRLDPLGSCTFYQAWVEMCSATSRLVVEFGASSSFAFTFEGKVVGGLCSLLYQTTGITIVPSQGFSNCSPAHSSSSDSELQRNRLLRKHSSKKKNYEEIRQTE